MATRVGHDARAIAAAARLAWRLPAANLLVRTPHRLAGRTSAVWIVLVTGGFAIALTGMFHWMSSNSRQTVIADTYSSSSNLALSVEQFVARTMETVDLTLRIVTENVVGDGARSGHDLQMLLADRITVLRDGRYVVTDDASKFDRARIIQAMVGRDLSNTLYGTRKDEVRSAGVDQLGLLTDKVEERARKLAL